MTDILLQKFFEPERWEKAIETGVGKGIDKGELRQLCSPEIRATLYIHIKNNNYEIAPSHMAQIPKDDGTYRTVYINENIDRIFLSITNDLLFEMFPDMIHSSCKSYQKGIGCGKVVQEAVKHIHKSESKEFGVKMDLSKYFDSVPIQFIDDVFDEIEGRIGKSKIIDILRKYYHTDLCFDLEGNLIEQFSSLKQGCAVASFLADVMLYHIDEELSSWNEYYVRYSDDILYIGDKYPSAISYITNELEKMSMKLNPKKVEYLSKDKWFKFLGFNIKGDQITLSKSRLKTFQKEVEARLLKNNREGMTEEKAVNKINAYLYKGDGTYSWGTSVLPIINVQKDIDTLNKYVMDAIRAAQTGKTKIGGLGSCIEHPDFTIMRGTGRNVKANKEKVPGMIIGYYSIRCMQNAILSRRAVYETIVRGM